MQRSYMDSRYYNKSNNVRPEKPKNVVKTTSVPTDMLTDMIKTMETANYNQGYLKGFAKGLAGFTLAAGLAGLAGYFIGTWKANKDHEKEQTRFDESNFKEVKEETTDGDTEL